MGVGEEQACTALGTALKITSFNTFDIEAPAKGTGCCTADPPCSGDSMCHFACPQNVQPTHNPGDECMVWGWASPRAPQGRISPWRHQGGTPSTPDHEKREQLRHCSVPRVFHFFSLWCSGLFSVFATKCCTAASREHFCWPSWPLVLMLFSGLSLGRAGK